MLPLNEGQVFTVAPPRAPASPLPWLIPLGIGASAALVLVLSIGLSTPPPTPFKPSTESPNSDPQTVPVVTGSSQGMAIARIHAPGTDANFRTAPTRNSPIQATIRDGELVESTGRQVRQDGTIWAKIRYRNQSGWVAITFLEGR